jgi:predicted DNA-binding antitoxin AbrB/MazE fold protein
MITIFEAIYRDGVFEPQLTQGLNVMEGERVQLSMVHRPRNVATGKSELLPDPPFEGETVVAPCDLYDLNRFDGQRISVRHIEELRPDGVGLD